MSFDVETDQLEPAMRVLADHGLRGLTSQPPTIEELFMREYGDFAAREAARSAANRVGIEPADAQRRPRHE